MTKNITINNVRCEYLVNPEGIDASRPRLSWQIETTRRGWRQSAYRVLAASRKELLERDQGDLWDSGKVASSRTNQVEYAGVKLNSRMQCWWKVCVWDADDVQSGFSPVARWTMGLLEPGDWQASWIGMPKELYAELMGGNDPLTTPIAPPYLRKGFTADGEVVRATAYVTARGLYELSINGAKVGDDMLAPGWTDYNTRIQYRSHDVTAMLKRGDNALGAIVGDGWYAGFIGWQKCRGKYGSRPSVLVQLEIEYADGRRQTIATDGSWRCSTGPIMSSDFMMGEVYDARKEIGGWDRPGFDDSAWRAAEVFDDTTARLVAHPCEPIRVTQELAPKDVTEPQSGRYIFDMGQNFSGLVRLKISAPSGTAVTIRHGERLKDDGTLYTENLRQAKSTDVYICKGQGEEIWQPRFTFHGFQYVELSGLAERPKAGAVTGLVVHSDTPPAGSFECSSDLVNRLCSNIKWGQRSNFISVPTDCPQRDERLGWTGDAEVFINTATYNMDVAAFFTKWMRDVSDAQDEDGQFPDIAPRINEKEPNYNGLLGLCGAGGWADAGVIVPWTIWRTYGDERIISEHWEAMGRWMRWLHSMNPGYLRLNGLGNNYGDWLCIPADTRFGVTSPMKEYVASVFWAADAKFMSQMARVIGKEQEAKEYEDLFGKIRQAVVAEYIGQDGSIALNTQTAYLLALAYGIMPEELRAAAAEKLVELIKASDWHLTTGFIGIRLLNPVLTDMGYADVAYRLLNNTTYPSWLYPVTHGATTIWERWDGWTHHGGFQKASMNSFNHYSLGSVGEWLFRSVAGIGQEDDSNGFERPLIRPLVGGGFGYARASYNSVGGRINSGWKIVGDDAVVDVTIPANMMARVCLPAQRPEDITENGVPLGKTEGVELESVADGRVVCRVGSGSYSFLCLGAGKGAQKG